MTDQAEPYPNTGEAVRFDECFKRGETVIFGPPLVEGKMSNARAAELRRAIDSYGYKYKLFDTQTANILGL